VKEVLSNMDQLALDFLVGRLILIAFLAVIYAIGLSSSGIDNAILISILAAVLLLTNTYWGCILELPSPISLRSSSKAISYNLMWWAEKCLSIPL